MDITEKTPVPPTEERLQVDLRRLEWTKGLSDETLTAITNKAEWVEFHTGQVVIEVDCEVTHVYLLIRGQMHVAFMTRLGLRETEHAACTATSPKEQALASWRKSRCFGCSIKLVVHSE